MSKINDDGAAFVIGFSPQPPGMSLRDWFAGQALAGIISARPGPNASDHEIVSTAYAMADAMLLVRGADNA